MATVEIGRLAPGTAFPTADAFAGAFHSPSFPAWAVFARAQGAWAVLDVDPPPPPPPIVHPAIEDAAGLGRSVTVTFNKAVNPATLGGAADWSVSPLAAGVHVVVTQMAPLAGDRAVVLTTLPEMTTVESYRVTAPATVADPEGLVIDPAGRTADFLVPRKVEPESATAWGASADGDLVDVGAGWLELVPWGPNVPPANLDQLVWLSLFSDRRAGPDDELPDRGGDPVYRGGWWADTYTGDSFGSKLWLLARSPVNATTLLKVRQYAEEALAWMVDTGIAARVDVMAERQDLGRVALKVVVSKTDGTKEAVAYPDLWSAFAAAA